MRSMLASLLLASAAAPAASQDLLAVTADGDLVRIDTADPSVVIPIGSLGLPAGQTVGTMTYDPSLARLYAVAARTLAPNDVEYSLVEVDPQTGASSVVGTIMRSSLHGHVESIDYVHSIDELVVAHSDGGSGDFRSDQFSTVDPAHASRTFLRSASLDNDASCYDPRTDTLYSLDPNGTDWSLLDLRGGPVSSAGPAIDTIGDLSLFPPDDAIHGIDFVSNRLYRFAVSSGSIGVGGEQSLGVVPGPAIVALAFRTDPTVGTAYCVAFPNSTGVSSELLALGSDVLAANALTLSAVSLPPNAFGLFLVSRTSGFAPNAGGGAGTLCLGGSIGRYVGPGEIMNSRQLGAFSLAVDLGALPQPTGFVTGAVGESWRFQAWHRETAGTGQATSNFTQDVEIVLR